MTRRPLLGLSLHADRAFLSHHRALIEDQAELFEVMPEGLWGEGAEPSAAYDLFRDIQQRSGRPFVAHGTLFSLGSAEVPARRELWLDALRRDQEVFDFLWFSDHFGFADHDINISSSFLVNIPNYNFTQAIFIFIHNDLFFSVFNSLRKILLGRSYKPSSKCFNINDIYKFIPYIQIWFH